MSELDSTIEKVQRWVHNAFPVAKERNIAATDSLLESGIIDSMGTLEVVDFLETDFGIEVLDDEMVADHFDSISSIAKFIASKQSQPNAFSD
ncbi:acyl carrier protein [Rubripirellula sp.]|nr:acyl carrier protein [Rubripirellula sp.]MDB4634049.1 acyl carrier protein [Rubripirellula sp.]